MALHFVYHFGHQHPHRPLSTINHRNSHLRTSTSAIAIPRKVIQTLISKPTMQMASVSRRTMRKTTTSATTMAQLMTSMWTTINSGMIWKIGHRELRFRINHMALNALLRLLNSQKRSQMRLPIDARTLLGTTRCVIPVQPHNDDGEYWHNGLQKCVLNAFQRLNESISISLNINIDGMPVFNSSKVSFWPILVNIFEFPSIQTLVIGIYCDRV